MELDFGPNLNRQVYNQTTKNYKAKLNNILLQEMGSSSIPSVASKVIQTIDDEDHEELVTMTEKVNLTKNQYEVLNIVCNTYEESISRYLQEAIVEAMRFDIEEGNLSDVLLEKIRDKKEESISKEKNSSTLLTGSSVGNDLGVDLQF